jgi:hypothetical protein
MMNVIHALILMLTKVSRVRIFIISFKLRMGPIPRIRGFHLLSLDYFCTIRWTHYACFLNEVISGCCRSTSTYTSSLL